RDEHRAGGIRGVVEDERLVLAPRREQAVLEADLGHALEVDRRDDLVGVDVAAPQRDPDAGVARELLHQRAPSFTSTRSAGLDSVPRMAVAAATSGLTRWVRPPLPWRPSKLRLDVDALRSP